MMKLQYLTLHPVLIFTEASAHAAETKAQQPPQAP